MSNASQGLGDAVKGVFNAVHGAGEVIRGTINDSVDKVGEGIASDGKTTGTDAKRQNDLALSGHTPQDHQGTVSEGKEQLGNGINALSNAGKGSSNSQPSA